MDVAYYSGSGTIGTYYCENMDDQFFYFRRRGRVLKTGLMKVENSQQCVDVAGSNGFGDVNTWTCDGGAD